MNVENLSHLVSHVGQVSLHGVGILSICVVFRLHLTNPVEEQQYNTSVTVRENMTSYPLYLYNGNLGVLATWEEFKFYIIKKITGWVGCHKARHFTKLVSAL